MEKEVIRTKNGITTVDLKECHPRQLALTSKYIAPYWFEAFHTVFKYEKERGLQEVHKLTDDRRVEAGMNLYKNGHIKETVVTKHIGGDVRAVVLSENKTAEYTVIIKDYIPDKLPQTNPQRERFIANLFVDCDCSDHHLSHYKDNSSMLCKHINCILWFLMNDTRFNMPRIFISPELKMVGYQKSETEELETEIKALPLIHFSQYINILLLKKYRGLYPALGISVHKVNNKNNLEMEKPQWLTFVEITDVTKLIRGITKAYKEMARVQGKTEEQINDELDEMLLSVHPEMPKRKKWWKFW